MIALLALPPILLAASAAAIRLCRSMATGAALLVVVYLIGALGTEPAGFLFGGINVYLEDLAGDAICLAAVLRLAMRPVKGNRPVVWLLFTAAVMVSFAVGSASYGMKAAGVEFRGYFYLCAAALYCASFPFDSRRMKTLVTVWLAGAAALLALAWFRWCAGALQLSIASSWAAVGGGNPLRVLNAGQTFYLAQALLMAIYLRRRARSRRLWNAMAAILAVTIVLLQHRSVWVALAIAAAAVAWREGALRRLLLWTAALALIAGCAMLPMAERFSRGNTVAESIGASIAEPFDPEKSTFAWRIGVWQSYLLEYAGAPVAGKIFGTGLGNPASYAVAAMEVEFSAHNYFIYTLNRTGAAGLLALAAVYWTLLRRLRGARGSWDYLGLLFAATVSQLIYCTVYSPSYDQGLLIGAVFGIVSGRLSRDQQPVCRDSGPQPA